MTQMKILIMVYQKWKLDREKRVFYIVSVRDFSATIWQTPHSLLFSVTFLATLTGVLSPFKAYKVTMAELEREFKWYVCLDFNSVPWEINLPFSRTVLPPVQSESRKGWFSNVHNQHNWSRNTVWSEKVAVMGVGG
jgi:hypothetical protein